MSDYVYRKKMQDQTCHQCEEGTITGNKSAVSCNNDDCNFSF